MSEQEMEQSLQGGGVVGDSLPDEGMDINAQILQELRSINGQISAVAEELAITRRVENKKFGRRMQAAVAIIGLATLSAVGVISYGAARANNTIEQAEQAINNISTKRFAEDFARYGRVAACHEMEGFQEILPKDIKKTCGFKKEKKNPADTASFTKATR